jgi:hypothetical protein
MKRILGLLLIVVVVAFAAGCSKTMVNFSDQPLSMGNQNLTMEQVDKSIIVAGSKRGWVMTKAGEGHMIGTLNVRVHMVQVDVKYNTHSFTIAYRNSTNLDYNPQRGTIHRSYNTWITNLKNDIQATVPLVAVE